MWLTNSGSNFATFLSKGSCGLWPSWCSLWRITTAALPLWEMNLKMVMKSWFISTLLDYHFLCDIHKEPVWNDQKIENSLNSIQLHFKFAYIQFVYHDLWGYKSKNSVRFGSGNDLLPVQLKVITLLNADLLSIGPWRTDSSEMSVAIQTFSLNEMRQKMLSLIFLPNYAKMSYDLN